MTDIVYISGNYYPQYGSESYHAGVLQKIHPSGTYTTWEGERQNWIQIIIRGKCKRFKASKHREKCPSECLELQTFWGSCK